MNSFFWAYLPPGLLYVLRMHLLTKVWRVVLIYTREGHDTNFAPGWFKRKTLLDFFKKVLGGKCMEHNFVVYLDTLTHYQMTVTDRY